MGASDRDLLLSFENVRELGSPPHVRPYAPMFGTGGRADIGADCQYVAVE